jgi:hypothetical protein
MEWIAGLFNGLDTGSLDESLTMKLGCVRT